MRPEVASGQRLNALETSPAAQRDHGVVAVVIAARNEACRLPGLLAQLATEPGLIGDLVVVDGGSCDATSDVAALAGARVLRTSPGRGHQFALGARVVEASWLLLLHADGRLPKDWAQRIRHAVACRDTSPRAWYFELAINGTPPALRVVELAVHLRSRWRQLPYGDQGLLLPRSLYEAVGGMRPLPLMEDLDLVQRLGRHCRFSSLRASLCVDGRRWLAHGVWRTTLTNLQLRRAWRRGITAEELARRYYQ